ncbi:MAG: hypothetical protein ABI891_15000 [Acidobacteriota bacterium]
MRFERRGELWMLNSPLFERFQTAARTFCTACLALICDYLTATSPFEVLLT